MSKGKWNKPFNTLMSVGLATSLVLPTLSSPIEAATNSSDLLISEYIEGSSFNKAIELYNGTGSTINLSEYTLELYSNGSSTANQNLTLSGTLANGETYVIYHGSANDDIKSKGDLLNSTVINFNGDDAVILKRSGEVVDSIGQVGARVGNLTDVTLVRNSNISFGDTIINDAFDPSVEWTSLPKDDSSNLGLRHIGDAVPVDPEEPAELVSIADARSISLGETVSIKGIVTAELKNTLQVQDATGGIAVRPTSLDMSLGDEVTLTGTLSDYRGLLQLDRATIVEKTENMGVPTPKVVTGEDVTEEYESQLVTTQNVEIIAVQEGDSWANYTATDGANEFIVRDENNNLDLAIGNIYESITGIVQQFNDVYQVIPRSLQDIVMDSSMIQPIFANPGSGTFVGSTTITLSTNTSNAKILYTLDGTNPTENGLVYDAPIEITENTTLKAIIKTEEDQIGDVETFEYTITDALQIHDIQGDDHESPFDGQTVENLEGIVTYSFALNGSHYYHIQTPDELVDDNPNTSEGIILYSGKNAWPIEVGDLVAVTGEVSEYAIDGFSDRQQTDLKSTQINVRNDRGKVTVIEKNVELPEPININKSNLPTEHIDNDGLTEFNPEEDAIDFWESLEGMRVEVGNVKAVAPQEHGDLITVLESRKTNTLNGGVLLEEDNQNPDRIQFRMEPNRPARDFEVATGDRFEGPIEGVVGYSYQNYKIYVSLDVMKEAHVEGKAEPETTTIEKAEDKLTIASYNLENFSNNTSETSADKAQKLARAFAIDMKSPDIIGVTEVQDNNGQDAGGPEANESYERLIAEIEDAGGVKYEYVNIDPAYNKDGGAPNANIRVGILYNPKRVTLTEGIKAGDATTAVGYENGKLTHNPGRIDPTNEAFEDSRKPLAAQFDFQGESVVVIVNHWNSKSGDTPLFGSTQPPQLSSEGQRREIANVVYDFVENIKSKNPDANIVSVGDFNDFQFSNPLKIHEGEFMTNMINKVEESDRYTYLYQGNSQVLDHILVSNHLVNQTEIDILHINADFTDMAGRASDHDPVLIQTTLKKSDEDDQEIEDESKYNKVYDLVGFNKKKLVIGPDNTLIKMDETSSITDGIYLKKNATLKGEGLKNTKVVISSSKKGAIVDFTGTEVKEVVIQKDKIQEIRGAENVQKWNLGKKVDPSHIKFTNSNGEEIDSPF